jgi:hypothetical protein
MISYRVIALSAALLLPSAAAHAQRWGGSPVGRDGSSGSHQATAQSVSAASPNGTPSKWGGSPVDTRSESRARERLERGTNAYIPVAIAAPEPVPAVASGNLPCPQADGSVEMPVITTQHEPRQLTTIEVYRLQPRFQRYQQP